jgi:hypothetical protein
VIVAPPLLGALHDNGTCAFCPDVAVNDDTCDGTVAVVAVAAVATLLDAPTPLAFTAATLK